jgi:hypothetical protein
MSCISMQFNYVQRRVNSLAQVRVQSALRPRQARGNSQGLVPLQFSQTQEPALEAVGKELDR